jgi:hypothetical protein
MLAIPSRDRKAFYREVAELLAYGDDGEPLALVMRDGHFFLTRFEECQANRRNRDTAGLQPGQNRTAAGPKQGPSLVRKPPETLRTETDLATEVRSKKREVRNSIGSDAKREGRTQAADPPTANRPADSEPGSLAKRLYVQHFERRYRKPRTNLDRYGTDFEKIEELAAEQPGSPDRVLAYVFRSFFADDSQTEWGQHSPATLAGEKGFSRHARGYAEDYAAEWRVQSEREHTDRVLANIEANEERCRRERAEMRNGQGGPVAVAGPLAEVMRSFPRNPD